MRGWFHKCDLLKPRVDYLGFEISTEGVHASHKRQRLWRNGCSQRASTKYRAPVDWLPIIGSPFEDSVRVPDL